MRKYDVCIVGATGLVGAEVLKILEERSFNINNLHLFASGKSEGTSLEFKGEKIAVKRLEEAVKADFAFFCIEANLAKHYAPLFAEKGCAVIDNSSEFRLHENVPLVVPEINPEAVYAHNGIIANPNCSTIQCAVALGALDRRFILKRVVVSTYQAVSGAGADAVADLDVDSHGALKKLPYIIKSNVIPLIERIEENGYSVEENKMINELRKILDKPYLGVSPTAVRVPVRNCHSVSINAEFEGTVDVRDAIEVLSQAKGVRYLDVELPMPVNADKRDEVFVGRLRKDYSKENTLNMWIVADNLRKGAALNAVQIAELFINKKNRNTQS